MELVLRPDWQADQFRRTIEAKKGQRRTLVFRRQQPVEVGRAELEALRPDIGRALVEVERDAKNRIRYVETVPNGAKEAEPDAAHV